MSKVSGWMLKTEAKYAAKYRNKFDKKITMAFQMGLDAAMIAANVVMHMGKGRAGDFAASYNEVISEMAGMILFDAKDDQDIEYTKAKIDARLKSICGENFQPWDERYGG